ncbi:hypothetical protein ACT6QH_10330 [Xanthobacter sp. TB0139]|uniref:hypothetical protein n=1 Tax=Xanthobacter sp. TB0139 TaxID=3459178 RepID=UPI004039DB2F
MSLPDTAPNGAACPAPRAFSRMRARHAAGWVVAARLTFVGLASAALAGCFQPMYAASTPDGGPGLREQLSSVEVMPINGSLGHVLRNDLIYDFNGGAGNPAHAAYQLLIKTKLSKSTALVNKKSGLPDNEIIRVEADWTLVRKGDPKKTKVAKGKSKGSATIDTSYQRFANYSAAKDAERRASQEIVADIRTQLLAHFIRSAGQPAAPGK